VRDLVQAARANGPTGSAASRLGLHFRVLADKTIGDAKRKAGELVGDVVEQSKRNARSSISLGRGFLSSGIDVVTRKLDPRLGSTNTTLQQVLLEAERKGVLALGALTAAVTEFQALQASCPLDPDEDMTEQLKPVTALIARALKIVDKAPASEEALSIRHAELDEALGNLEEDVRLYPKRLRTFEDQFGTQEAFDVAIWQRLHDRFEALDLDSEEPGDRLAQFCDLEAAVQDAVSVCKSELERFERDLRRLAELNDLYRLQVAEVNELKGHHPELVEPSANVLQALTKKPIKLDAADEAIQALGRLLDKLA